MKLITAVIQPERVEPVAEALLALGTTGLTLTEVSGYGRQGGHTEVYRGADYQVDAVPKVRIEVLVVDEHETAAIDAIVRAARTGNIGDGKVWSVEVSNLIRVRTGESGPSAL